MGGWKNSDETESFNWFFKPVISDDIIFQSVTWHERLISVMKDLKSPPDACLVNFPIAFYGSIL
jgi:hypothetical protein